MSHRTFSWTETGTEAEIFEVQRVGALGEGWERSQTLATLHSPDLLEPCINHLRQNGWSWVPAGSSLLRRAFASQLHTDPEPESTADPEEAFSGRGRS